MDRDGLAHADTESERTALADAVDAFAAGDRPHVAVVGPPFAGRSALLDHATDLLDGAARIAVSSLADESITWPDSTAVVVDDCQYLYTRTIDGYAPFEAFADTLVEDDRFVVTGWNRHAWDYLAAVRNVDDLFSVVVETPPLSSSEMEAFVTAAHDGPLPSFEANAVTEPTGDGARLALPGGRSLPLPTVSLARFGDALGDDSPEEKRARVFETLTAQSNGNPGVAWPLWRAAVEDGTVTPAAIRDAVPEVSLDDEAGFALATVLANERLSTAKLRAVVGDRRYWRSRRQLRGQDLVTVAGDEVAINPAAVPSATAFCSRRRLLW